MAAKDTDYIAIINTLRNEAQSLSAEVNALHNIVKNNNKIFAAIIKNIIPELKEKIEANGARLDNHFAAFKRLENASRTETVKLHELSGMLQDFKENSSR